jgi:putative GTP pyrophosphokinase
MIIEREIPLNVQQITRELTNSVDPDALKELTDFVDYYQLCHAAVKEVCTKLENLDADYATHFAHNPIHHMETRMKDPDSLIKKLQQKGLPVSNESMKNNLYDIGGIRIMTNYPGDIYTVADNLLAQDDITLVRRRDYVQQPKPSGYRSLHLVVKVPVFQSTGARIAPVEVQIRTIGMDMWASLEHKLRYKTNVDDTKLAEYADLLVAYSDELMTIENGMQDIYTDLNQEE